MRVDRRTSYAIGLTIALGYNTPALSRGQAHALHYGDAVVALAVRLGWARWVKVLAVPPQPLEAPLLACAPGGKKQDFGPLAYAVSRRGLLEPSESRVLIITQRGANLVGGFVPTMSHPGQMSHNLALGSVLVSIYQRRPAEAARWCGESLLRTRHIQENGYVPDAAIISAATAKPETYIDFAGSSYTASRLSEMWAAAWTAGVNLEVW